MSIYYNYVCVCENICETVRIFVYIGIWDMYVYLRVHMYVYLRRGLMNMVYVAYTRQLAGGKARGLEEGKEGERKGEW